MRTGQPHPCMACTYDKYSSPRNIFEVPPVLQALLAEDGTYMQKLIYGVEKHQNRNPFFAVCLHSVEPTETWKPASLSFQVSLCYEITDEFPLTSDAPEYTAFRESMERIVQTVINLLPYSTFQRCVGLYDGLFAMCTPDVNNRPNDFACLIRRYEDSFVDLRLCVVMRSRIYMQARHIWDSRDAASDSSPCAEESDWSAFFRCMSRIRWYAVYVCTVLDVDDPDENALYTLGMTKLRLMQSIRDGNVNVKDHHLTTGKLALLETAEKAYRYSVD